MPSMAGHPSNRDLLVGFVNTTYNDLGTLLQIEDLFDSRTRAAALEAWQELSRFVKHGTSELMVRGDRGEDLEQRLNELGLTGVLLNWRLTRIQAARQVAIEAAHNMPRLSRSYAWRRLLNWIDTILKSLTKAIPVLTPLEEFKDATKESLKDRDSDEGFSITFNVPGYPPSRLTIPRIQ
jgi:hypothetical protein